MRPRIEPLYRQSLPFVIQFPSWTRDAACEGSEVHVLPDIDKNSLESREARRQALAEARSMCAECPVRDECLAEGLRVDSSCPVMGHDAVYGGLTFRERKDLRARLERGERGLWSA